MIEEPLCASTPLARPLINGHEDRDSDTVNGNIEVHIVSESTNSMDVLSGGESDAGDTLNRRNNNSISSTLAGTLRGNVSDLPYGKKRCGDPSYCVAKELLMTERTYKRDIDLVTVTFSSRVSSLAAEGAEVVAVLARACLALEPLALPAAALVAKLERTLAASASNTDENDEPEYKKIAEVLYDYLYSTAEAYTEYIERAGTIVESVESVRRQNPAVDKEIAAFDASSPLPLACLLLRPLHRLLHLERLAIELSDCVGGSVCGAALRRARSAARQAALRLRPAHSHALLCQLQRDILGYDKLLVPDREFVRLGCLYKHSTRGLQQRMLFLFSDVLVLASRAGGGAGGGGGGGAGGGAGAQFRAHAALPAHALHVTATELPHSFTITGENVNMLLSASNETEFNGWFHALQQTTEKARESPACVDIQLTPYEQEVGSSDSWNSVAGGAGGAGGALAHVCWHRVTALSRDHLDLAIRTQLSGYLLRKFKNSHGWQKLWVVFAAATLYFYKTCHDNQPLASLPLLGYSVGAPAESDAIHKELVFKLQFKNHVYFFRADTAFTYHRWTEVLRTVMLQSHHDEI